eukprot:g10902.t1
MRSAALRRVLLLRESLAPLCYVSAALVLAAENVTTPAYASRWRANETAAYRPAAEFEVVVIAPEQAFSPNEVLHLNADPDVLDSFRDVVRGEIAELNEQAGLEVGTSADVAPIKDVQPRPQEIPRNSKAGVRVRSAQKWTVWTPFLVHGIGFNKLLSQDVLTVEEVGTIYNEKLLGDDRLRTRQLYDLPASRFAYKNVSLHFNLHAKETLRSEQKKEIQVLKDRIASLRSSYGRGYNLVPSRRADRVYDDWSSWFDRGAHDLRRWEFVDKWEPKPSSGREVEHEGLLSRFKDELFFRSQQTNKTHDLGYQITQVRSMHVFEQMLAAYVSAMDHVLARRRAHFEPFGECSAESRNIDRKSSEAGIAVGAAMGVVSADTKMPLTQDADYESAPSSDDGRGMRSSSSITAAPDENERAYREAAHYGERPFLVRPPFSGDLVEAGVYLGGNAMLMAIASLPAFIFRKSAARYLNTFGKVAGPVLFKQKAYVEKEVEKFVDNALLGDEEEGAGPALEQGEKKHLDKTRKDVDEQEVYMQPRSVWLFDTFEGIPPPEGDKDDPEAVQNYLNRGGGTSTSKPRPRKIQAAGVPGVVSVVQEVGVEQGGPLAETAAAAAAVPGAPPPAPSATPAVYNREPSQSTLDHSVASEESWLDSTTGELRWNYGPYEVVRKHMQMTHFPMENVHLVRGKVEDTLSLESRRRRSTDRRGAATGGIPESISLLC